MTRKYYNVHSHFWTGAPDETIILNLYPYEFDEGITALDNYYSIGLHPWHVENPNHAKDLQKIREAAAYPNTLAIGEIGLDKVVHKDLKQQTQVFRKQVELSEEFEKPVIIHCVKAYQEIIGIKKEMKVKMPWIIHGFNKKPEVLRQLVNQGFYLSFGSQIINKQASLRDSLKEMPPENLFFETDEEEISIKTIYLHAAEILKKDPEQLKMQIEANFKKCFMRNGLASKNEIITKP